MENTFVDNLELYPTTKLGKLKDLFDRVVLRKPKQYLETNDDFWGQLEIRAQNDQHEQEILAYAKIEREYEEVTKPKIIQKILDQVDKNEKERI